MVDNSVITVVILKLHLWANLFIIFIMFKLVTTKIAISIPEKSSVEIANFGESFA
ncbi:hypothetical protein SAMN04488513_107182 [Pseudozobellia thermophila]|uniref:Uncharacterized protein n=1 Tax=Pseudozobellia thermophila TaxID=192903 RepID=A0A1M6LJ84_9FLAO|nr:hypothetical protein SAMN04488513_107182 [Pseudozobellia thermophila]